MPSSMNGAPGPAGLLVPRGWKEKELGSARELLKLLRKARQPLRLTAIRRHLFGTEAQTLGHQGDPEQAI